MTEGITSEDARYAFEIIETICSEVGPGMPGTPQERQRAEIFKKELESHLGAENVAFEEFSVAPWGFLPAMPLSAVLLLLAAMLNLSTGRIEGIPLWLTSSASLVIAVLAPLTLFFVFYLNHEWLDKFYKPKPSENLIGTLHKPRAQKVKRLLIISGHHDSAPENTWLRFLGAGFMPATALWVLGFAAMLAAGITQLAGIILSSPAVIRFGTLGWVVVILFIAPSMIYGLFFNRGRKGGGNVPGAVDNLSASALATALCRFLVDHPGQIPEDTEIRFISFGSEEVGLRGSRRYVERNLNELKRLDTRVLNIEMVADPVMVILSKDGIVAKPEAVDGAVKAARRAGVPYRVEGFSFGAGTDGASFARAGIHAVTLQPFKLPQQMYTIYHQKGDSPEVLTIEPLLNVLKLALEWVRAGGE